ncbi:hypothetical protein BO83DRAFT_327452, partial [Aspergillus eucalypticola CBS 122712]
TDFRRYPRIHSSEQLYHCEGNECNKSSRQNGALKVHLRTHTGEKPYSCQYRDCLEAFSNSSTLARHRRFHAKKASVCMRAAQLWTKVR